jgi:hypothetical protein
VVNAADFPNKELMKKVERDMTIKGDAFFGIKQLENIAEQWRSSRKEKGLSQQVTHKRKKKKKKWLSFYFFLLLKFQWKSAPKNAGNGGMGRKRRSTGTSTHPFGRSGGEGRNSARDSQSVVVDEGLHNVRTALANHRSLIGCLCLQV